MVKIVNKNLYMITLNVSVKSSPGLIIEPFFIKTSSKTKKRYLVKKQTPFVPQELLWYTPARSTHVHRSGPGLADSLVVPPAHGLMGPGKTALV